MPPTCVGTLQKTTPKSWFRSFHKNSPLADSLFIDQTDCQGTPLVILQVMIFGDNEFLAEIIKKEDYEKVIGVEEATRKGLYNE